MTTATKRDIATSATALLFTVIGTTGVLMYFHILDNYTKQMHEILGLAFVVAILLHIMVNFKNMKKYFAKKIFFVLTFVTVIIVSGFIINAPEGKNPKSIVFTALFNAEIETSFLVFVEDFDLAKIKLEEAGINIEGLDSIGKIAKANKTSPFDIVKILSKN